MKQKSFQKIFLVIVSFLLCLKMVNAQNSENGYWFPNKGTMRVLLVFAEVKNDIDSNLESNKWNSGELPKDTNNYFALNTSVPLSSDDSKQVLTKYFLSASFGSYHLIGDVFPYFIQLNKSEAGYSSIKSVIKKMNEYDEKNLKSMNGFYIHGGNKKYKSDFDSWITSGVGMPKINKPDSMLDMLIVVWRVNGALSRRTNSGYCSVMASNEKIKGYKGLNCYSEFVSHDNDAMVIMRHEFSHTLYGGNNFHTAGPGAGLHCFINAVTGYSNLSSWDKIGDGYNAWDRWRMGWKNPDKQFLIGGLVFNEGVYSSEIINENNFSEINLNEISFKYSPDKTIYLRDFETTGDAVRIELPFPDITKPKQYLWLEYHDIVSALDLPNENRKGLYAYISIGKNDKTQLYLNGNTSPGNYLFFLPANGRWDYDYGFDSAKQKVFQKLIDTLPNPLTGNHDLMRPVIDANSNGKLNDDAMILAEEFIHDSDTSVYYPAFGMSADIPFKYSGNNTINICSNPSSNNITTCLSPLNKKSISDIDTIYINGLSIEIIDSIIISGNKTLPALGIKINWNDYNITNDVRWCGNIVLKPPTDSVSMIVKDSSSLILDRGISPTQMLMNKTDSVNGKLFFSNPTSFVVNANSTIHIEKGSKLILRNASVIYFKKGSRLIVDDGAEIITDASSKIIYE